MNELNIFDLSDPSLLLILGASYSFSLIVYFFSPLHSDNSSKNPQPVTINLVPFFFELTKRMYSRRNWWCKHTELWYTNKAPLLGLRSVGKLNVHVLTGIEKRVFGVLLLMSLKAPFDCKWPLSESCLGLIDKPSPHTDINASSNCDESLRAVKE